MTQLFLIESSDRLLT